MEHNEEIHMAEIKWARATIDRVYREGEANNHKRAYIESRLDDLLFDQEKFNRLPVYVRYMILGMQDARLTELKSKMTVQFKPRTDPLGYWSNVYPGGLYAQLVLYDLSPKDIWDRGYAVRWVFPDTVGRGERVWHQFPPDAW